MNEKHSINNSRKTESAPGAAPEEPRSQNRLSRLLKNAMPSSDGGDFFKNLLKDEFAATPEGIDSFLDYARKHSGENTKLDAYNLIQARVFLNIAIDTVKHATPNAPSSQAWIGQLISYMESWQEYGKRLEDRQKAIHDLSQAIDLISDPVAKKAVSQKCDNLLDVHEEITFLRYAMEELRFEAEKGKQKQKHSITTLGTPNDPLFDEIARIRNELNSLFDNIAKNDVSHGEKLDQLHELSKASIIRQEEIKGELPHGGIKYLKKLIEEGPKELIKRYAERFSKVTSSLSPVQWKVYKLHRDGESNAKIAKALSYSHSHIGRMLKEIDMVFKKNNLPSGIIFYVQMKREPSYVLDDDNKVEFSSCEMPDEYDEDGND
jgi:nitrogen regulatory protein PII-like uncharacterized protein